MDLINQVRALAARIAATKSLISAEEATKNAMLMAEISAGSSRLQSMLAFVA